MSEKVYFRTASGHVHTVSAITPAKADMCPMGPISNFLVGRPIEVFINNAWVPGEIVTPKTFRYAVTVNGVFLDWEAVRTLLAKALQHEVVDSKANDIFEIAVTAIPTIKEDRG